MPAPLTEMAALPTEPLIILNEPLLTFTVAAPSEPPLTVNDPPLTPIVLVPIEPPVARVIEPALIETDDAEFNEPLAPVANRQPLPHRSPLVAPV